MGVRGLTSILKEAVGSVSKEDHFHSVSGSKPIPAGSTFAVDGSGLVYYIHNLAYRTHYRNILSLVQSNDTAAVEYDALISSLLPSLMPLDVMTHTCQSLLEAWVDRAGLDLCIYLDNTTFNNPFKTATSEQREDQRDEEENRLQDFLLHSSLPPSWATSSPQTDTLHNLPSADEFLNTFPRGSSKLWYLQILRDIHEFQRSHADHVTVIECQGDADIDVAFHAADDVSGNTFCVGGDSDYFIFGGESSRFAEISYIPFESLQWNDGMLEGKVWTRSSVTQLLGLPDEAALIEYSILLGNDYTKPFLMSIQDIETRTDLFLDSEITFILSHLAWKDRIRIQVRHKGAGYRVSSNHTELDQAIRYSRDLYTFQDLSKYRTVEGDDNIEKEDSGLKKLIQRMGLDTFPVDGAHVQPADTILSHNTQHDALRYRILGSLRQYYESLTCGYTGIEGGRGFNDAVELSVASRFILSNWGDYTVALDQSLLPKAIASNNADMIFPCNVNWYDYCMMALIELLIVSYIKDINSSHSLLHSRESMVPSLITNTSTNYHGIFNKHQFLLSIIELRGTTSSLNSIIKKKRGDRPKIYLHPARPFSSAIEPRIVTIDKDTDANIPTIQKIKEHPLHPTSSPSAIEVKVLPIDEHKDTILQTIQKQSVTVIQGETGCGKSSRIPVMILQSPSPDPSVPIVKMFITQPRRIAAKALVEWVRVSEPTLQDKFALRLGHGVREYESDLVQAWFCTTGYLVQYLANNVENFRYITHLIIDEVHERSVETDLLCLLTKRLLFIYPHLRLVLMSATIAAEMYTEYFDVPRSPIYVSARRFPIREYYLEDLDQVVSLQGEEKTLLGNVLANSAKQQGSNIPMPHEIKSLHQLAVYLTIAIGKPRTSVLIFVAGMNDIIHISELIEKIKIPGKTFTCLPIHGEIPIEDQMVVFQPAGPSEVKVIVATNVAESSITLPDVDNVICLGLCKQLTYNEYTHRSMLGPTRISKASAKQRAGRTGRVREGSVYRLYSRKMFELHMVPFDLGEILRMPLDTVILSVKRTIPNEDISDLLSRLIEPPEQRNIERSLDELHRQRFLTEPTKNAPLTSLGLFVASLGVDLRLGTFISLAFKLGLPAEAISYAAILSFPKSPWLIGNAAFHDPVSYNDMVLKSYYSKSQFDSALYSEPLGTMNMLNDYENARHKVSFVHKHSLSLTRVKQLYSAVRHLQSKVTAALGKRESDMFRVEIPPRDMPLAKITALRLLHIFTFPDFIITSKRRENIRDDGSYRLTLTNAKDFKDEMLHELLNPHVFRYSVVRKRKKNIFVGTAVYETKREMVPSEESLLSYGIENNFQVILLCRTDDILAYISHDSTEQVQHLIDADFSFTETLHCHYITSMNMRGIRGRACGLWSVKRDSDDLLSSESAKTRCVNLFSLKVSKTAGERYKNLMQSLILCKVEFFGLALKSCPKNILGFTATVFGGPESITSQDASDLFLPAQVRLQAVIDDDKQDSIDIEFIRAAGENKNENLQGRCSLIHDIPVGARILTAIASGHRLKHMLVLPIAQKKVSTQVSDGAQVSDGNQLCIALTLSTSETRFVDHWVSLINKERTLVDNCSVPASAYDVSGCPLFACCGGYLEVKRSMDKGSAVVNGLTMLPSNPHFLALALTCIGYSIPSDLMRMLSCQDKDDNWGNSITYDERVSDAVLFNLTLEERGDSLSSDESLISYLCGIFDLQPWTPWRGSQK